MERRCERAWKGAVVGLGALRVTGVSWLGRAYQKDRRPKPLISLEKTILTSSPKTPVASMIRIVQIQHDERNLRPQKMRNTSSGWMMSQTSA